MVREQTGPEHMTEPVLPHSPTRHRPRSAYGVKGSGKHACGALRDLLRKFLPLAP